MVDDHIFHLIIISSLLYILDVIFPCVLARFLENEMKDEISTTYDLNLPSTSHHLIYHLILSHNLPSTIYHLPSSISSFLYKM